MGHCFITVVFRLKGGCILIFNVFYFQFYIFIVLMLTTALSLYPSVEVKVRGLIAASDFAHLSCSKFQVFGGKVTASATFPVRSAGADVRFGLGRLVLWTLAECASPSHYSPRVLHYLSLSGPALDPRKSMPVPASRSCVELLINVIMHASTASITRPFADIRADGACEFQPLKLYSTSVS